MPAKKKMKRITITNELLSAVLLALGLWAVIGMFFAIDPLMAGIYLVSTLGAILCLYLGIGFSLNGIGVATYVAAGIWTGMTLFYQPLFPKVGLPVVAFIGRVLCLCLVEAYWWLHRRFRLAGASPRGILRHIPGAQLLQGVEALSLVVSCLLATAVAGPVCLLGLGFLYEIFNPLCIHRARPLRGLLVVAFAFTGIAVPTTVVWLVCHWLRVAHEPQAAERRQRFVDAHKGHLFAFHGDIPFLGLPNPFVKFEVRSKGTCVVSGIGWSNTLKASNFLEADVEHAVFGYGRIRVQVKKGAAHSEKELIMTVPSPKWIAELLNQASGDPSAYAEPE